MSIPKPHPIPNTTEASPANRFTSTARWAGASDILTASATRCRQPRLIVSGRLASGKDTIAEAVMSAIGHQDAAQVSFASAIRKEVDQILDVVRTHLRQQVAPGCCSLTDAVADAAGIGGDEAARTAELAQAALDTNPAINSSHRTPEMRLLLQEWGTDVRRAQDPDYWVKQSMLQVLEHLAADHAVYVTDARFPNEVERARDLGFLTVRLEVDLPVRAARLRARDGLDIDPNAEAHPSEQQLEEYSEFDLRVDNSGSIAQSVQQVVPTLLTRFPRTTG
jgi:hypothetical protein